MRDPCCRHNTIFICNKQSSNCCVDHTYRPREACRHGCEPCENERDRRGCDSVAGGGNEHRHGAWRVASIVRWNSCEVLGGGCSTADVQLGARSHLWETGSPQRSSQRASCRQINTRLGERNTVGTALSKIDTVSQFGCQQQRIS